MESCWDDRSKWEIYNKKIHKRAHTFILSFRKWKLTCCCIFLNKREVLSHFFEKSNIFKYVSMCQTRSYDFWIMNAMCTFVYIFVYISSSCRAISMDIPDPLSLLSNAYSRLSGLHPVLAQGCLSCLCLSLWRGPQEYITYELIPTSPAVSRMSGSLILIVFVMGGRWMYSCCLQDLFNIAHSILVLLLSRFFSIHLVSVHVVHPYSSIDTTAASKKLRFILSVRSDFHMTESLLIAVHAFASRVLMSVLVGETLLPR